MKNGQNALAIAALLPLMAGMTGCEGAVWGNLGVLVFTVGIFLGTITLGRPRD